MGNETFYGDGLINCIARFSQICPHSWYARVVPTCMVCGREEPDVELQSLFDSQAHVIHEHKYCTIKCKTFRFALPDGNLFTREFLGNIRVLAKSRNSCKLSLFRCHSSAWFYIFIRFQAYYVTCHLLLFIIFYCISMAFSQ